MICLNKECNYWGDNNSCKANEEDGVVINEIGVCNTRDESDSQKEKKQ